MTIDEFFAELEALGLEWRVAGDSIRCADGECPISALVRARTGQHTYAFAASAGKIILGLDGFDSCDIVKASDGRSRGPLRTRLLNLVEAS